MEIKAAVKEYADTKQQLGARQLSITLGTAAIEFENNVLSITIHNETQREQLQSIKQEFLDQLRKKLQNNSIGMEILITQHEVQTKAYKPADIFRSMSEKNPALLELKKRFDLEIEY